MLYNRTTTAGGEKCRTRIVKPKYYRITYNVIVDVSFKIRLPFFERHVHRPRKTPNETLFVRFSDKRSRFLIPSQLCYCATKKGICVEARRYNIYGVLENKRFSIENVWLIVQHSLATPGTKVTLEKLCFIANVLWVIEKKKRFHIPTIKRIIFKKKNYYDFLLTEKIEGNSFIKVVWHKELTIQKTMNNRLESIVNENISTIFFKVTTRKITNLVKNDFYCYFKDVL